MTFAPAASEKANFTTFGARYLVTLETKRDGIDEFARAIGNIATLKKKQGCFISKSTDIFKIREKIKTSMHVPCTSCTGTALRIVGNITDCRQETATSWCCLFETGWRQFRSALRSRKYAARNFCTPGNRTHPRVGSILCFNASYSVLVMCFIETRADTFSSCKFWLNSRIDYLSLLGEFAWRQAQGHQGCFAWCFL